MRSLAFNVTTGVHGVFTDFAEYLELPSPRLFAMLAEEQQALADDKNSAELIADFVRDNQQLGGLRLGRKNLVLRGTVSVEAADHYTVQAERLDLPVYYVAKVAVLHGLIEEMAAEKFTFALAPHGVGSAGA